jgi:hypothetical protein
MGTGKATHLVNVIDFGLAKKFRDPRTSLHIPFKQDGQHGVGTSLFAAINTHLGIGLFFIRIVFFALTDFQNVLVATISSRFRTC